MFDLTLAAQSKDLVAGLAKGLLLLEAFDGAHTRLTLSDAARRVGISAAAARRSLLTLGAMGYVQTDGKLFWLDHGVLRLAYAYASSTRMPRLLQPALDALSERTRESASVAVLQGTDLLVAARSTAQRSLTVGLGVGSRLPLHCSATGRVLLAALETPERDALLKRLSLSKLTPRTPTDLTAVKKQIRVCRENGYGVSDEEIETGVRSLAVPLRNAQGQTIGALSISSRADRMTVQEMVTKLLPALLRTQAWAQTRL